MFLKKITEVQESKIIESSIIVETSIDDCIIYDCIIYAIIIERCSKMIMKMLYQRIGKNLT